MRRAVVDQSGLKIVVIGIIISVFLGLIFKSQIRPNVVKTRLEKTLVKLQKDINIDFESVEVQLSEWGIPRPVVVINGIRISPLHTLCNENQIYIESLSFPLSLNLLLSENKTINSLRMSLVEIRFKHLEQCLKPSHKETDLTNEVRLQNKTDNVQFDKIVERSSTHLKDISIDRLRLISPDNLKTAIDFNAVQMSLGYKENKLSTLQFQSQLMMFKDPNRNLYLLKSDARISLEMNESNFLNFDADIAGLILDRPIKIKVKTDAEKKTINLFGEFKSISLKALNYLVRSENRDVEIFDFLTGSTISGYMTGEYSLDKRIGEILLSKTKVYFGNGTVEVNDIHLSSNDGHWSLKPFDVAISRIDLTKVIDHPYFSKIKSSIQNTGFLSGMLQYDQNGRVKLNALLEKVSFYFSNRGIRLSQTFDRLNLKLIADSDKIDFSADDFIYNGHKILGHIHYLQKKQQSSQLLTADLKGEILSPDVIKLFTGMSYQPDMNINFQTDLKTKFTGKGTLSRFEIENLAMKDVAVDYVKDIEKGKENILIKSQSLQITQSLDEDYVLNQLFKPDVFSNSTIDLQSTRIEVLKYKTIEVKFKADADLVNASKSKVDKFKLSGTIDDKLNLSGDFGVKSSGKKSSFYNFSGPYDQLNIQQED